jgi:general stress protein 26
MAAGEPSRPEIEHAIAELLRDEEIAALATLASDGSPSASVMHIAADGLKVYLHTFVRTRKYGEMLAYPKVSYVASHLPAGGYGERELTRSLQVKGRATLVTSRAEIEHAVRLSLAQFPWAAETNLFTGVKRPEESQQVFFRIDPETAVWADNRVRMMWRVIVDFSADSSRISAVRPYRDAFAGRR